MIRKTFQGCKITVRAGKGATWGQMFATVNGESFPVAERGSEEKAVAEIVRMLADVHAAPVDGDRWPAHYYAPGTYELCETGTHPRAIGGTCTHFTCKPAAVTCDHQAGAVGCDASAVDCQGIPAPAHGVDTVQLPAPHEAEPGVYSVIRTVGNRLARVADVTGEPFHGTSNPYGRPGVRDFSVWEYAVNGRVVEVITYESRGPLDRDARHYAAVFVSGRLVEGAEALDMSRGPAGLAAEIAWRTARYLADTVEQVDTDDAPAETPADTDAPADQVDTDDAPAETGTDDADAYRPAGVPVVAPIPADWDGPPAEWYSTAQVAKLIRAAVKSYFPGVKFSVRSDSYAGGSSIRVAWTDGPTSDQVDKVTGQYAGAGFDGMADIKTYRGDVLVIGADGSRTAVRLGVDYVQTSRTESPELLEAMRPAASVMAGRELSADPTADNFPEGLADTLGVWPLGGDGRELLRFLARTRTADMRGSRDPRPACAAPGPFGRKCTLAAGHVFPLVHRDGNRDVFIAPANTAPAEVPADVPAPADQVDDAPAGFVSVHAAHHGGPALPACGLSLPVPADHGMMRAPADLQAGTTTGGPRVPFIDLVTCGGCREALTSGVTRPRCSRAVPALAAWGGIGACNAPADQVGTYRHASFTDSWCAEHADSDPRTFNGPTWAPLSAVVLAAPVEAPHPLPVEPPAPAPITAPAVHRFASTGEAYNASQTRDDIRDGDVLIVESERVAGFLLQAWPTTVTAEAGEFHTANGDPAEVEAGRYAVSVERAREIAATWDDGDQGNGGTPAPAGPDDDDTGAALTPAEVDAVRADVAAYHAGVPAPIVCSVTPKAWVTAHVDQDTAPAEVPADAPAPADQVDDGGPWSLRILPPGGNPSKPEEWRAGETFADRDAAMLAAVRLSESHHAHGVDVRGGAGRASNTVATWHAGTNVWQEWGQYGVDYGPGAEWVERARATYAAEVAGIVAAAANRNDPHSWQVIVFEASTHRATHTGESFESPLPASRHADRISHRPFNYTAFAYLVRVHAAATAVYRDADLEPVVIPHEATPADVETSDSVPATVDQDAAPAVTVSFDCPAHGVVPVPVDIDGPLARSIRQEHQDCTAGDPFGMAACERESTPAAHFARTLVAAGWTPEEAASAATPPAPAADDQGDALPPTGETDPVARWEFLGRMSSGAGSAEKRARWDRYVAAIRRVHGLSETVTHDELIAGRDGDPRTWAEKCAAYWTAYAALMAEDGAARTAAAEPLPAPMPAVDQVDADTTETPALAGPVRVADLVEGARAYVVGIDQYGSPTHGAGYVQGRPSEVTVKGRTPSGRTSKDPKKARPGLLVQVTENANGWNGWRMTIITTPDAFAEYVTDETHQFRPVLDDGNPYLVRARCSCGWVGGPGASRFASERGTWERHVTPPAEKPKRHTPEMLARAEELGRRAYADGRPSAGGAVAEVCALVAGWEVGTGAADVFAAFSRGHAAAADRAADAVLTADQDDTPAPARVVVTMEELEAARALGAEAHGFGAEQSMPHDDPAFTALVATLPGHIAPAPLESMYHRGYAEAAERAAYETARNLENNAVALAEARKVAELTAAAQWAVESTEAARASLAASLEKRTAQADQGDTPAVGDQEEAPDVYTLPLEAYTPVIASDQGGDLVITHDHEDGTVLHGSRRGDGVWEITRNNGFECRRGVMFIRNSRDRFARLHTIDAAAQALRAAGWTVAVEVDDVWRPAAVREEARAERASARAERLSDRACRQYGQSNARREAARSIGDMMPFGEPIKIGHHSEARHRRAFDRIDAHTRASIAAWDYAQNLASRAAGAVANESHKHDPGAIMRRIERLEAERRQWERSLADAVANNAPGQARRSMLEAEKIAEDVAYQRAKLGDMAETGMFVAWSREHFRPGDWAKVAGRWCEVVRVNAKSVSVRNRYGFGVADRAQPAPWDEIGGRRRDGLQWDTVNGEPWPIEQAQRVAKWRDLVRSLSVSCDRDDQDEARRRRHTGYARRLVLGLGRDAASQEVDAYGEPDTVEGRRARALACMDAWDRFEAGETFDQVAADTAPLADTAPAWTVPAGEPVDVRPRDLVPGDIVVGVYDRFFSSERLTRSIVGPVTAPTTERDRYESGEWATVTVDGVAHEMKAWRQLSAHLVGPRPAPAE